MDNFDAPQCVRVCPLRAVGRPWVGTYVLLTVIQNPVPQVRLELTTSACLTACTDYKYGALTDCATGAGPVLTGIACDIIPRIGHSSRSRTTRTPRASPRATWKHSAPRAQVPPWLRGSVLAQCTRGLRFESTQERGGLAAVWG